GKLVSNNVFDVNHLTTWNAATHFVLAYANASLATGKVQGGTTAIAATSINIICTAVITDAGGQLQQGVALRAIRFNPVPGSQEERRSARHLSGCTKAARPLCVIDIRLSAEAAERPEPGPRRKLVSHRQS